MSRSFRILPVDVVLVTLALVVFQAALRLPPSHPLRVVVVLAALLTLPGYVLTTATFPGYTPDPTTPSVVKKGRVGRLQFAALDDVERLALSFGLSLLLLPLLALGIASLGYPVGGRSLSYAVTAFVVVVGLIGLVRRVRLPASSRYDLPVGQWVGAARSGLYGGSPLDSALNVALALSIVVASAALVGAVAAPQDGYRYTEASLVTVDDQGEYVQQNYPTQFVKDQPRKITLVVDNREGEQVNYTVVVQLQRVNEQGRVTERSELDRYRQTVPAGGEWQLRHSIAPSMTGDRLRVVWLVYKGDVPPNPTMRNSDLSNPPYLWVEVVE